MFMRVFLYVNVYPYAQLLRKNKVKYREITKKYRTPLRLKIKLLKARFVYICEWTVLENATVRPQLQAHAKFSIQDLP
jgi:hypothetical protein